MMALVQNNSTVGTTPTLICAVPYGNRQNIPVYIHNSDAAAIAVGGSTVAMTGATHGHSVAAAGALQLWLCSGDKVYAVSAAGTAAGAVVVTYSA
jgi:hypothetical protein